MYLGAESLFSKQNCLVCAFYGTFYPLTSLKRAQVALNFQQQWTLLYSIVFWQTKLIESMADASHLPKDRSSHQRCSIKKVFLEISQNSQENTCSRVSFFNKVAGLRQTLLDDCLLKDPFLAFFTQFNSLRCCQSRALHLFTQTRF